jgi:hypothetical protein
MTAKEALRLNGDFLHSPLLETVKRIHGLFNSLHVPYAVIGGLAVLRNGYARTTIDIDILTVKEGWGKITASRPAGFAFEPDAAVDEENGVNVDILFEGDDWDLAFNLPAPGDISEFDADLQANFSSFFHTVQLKMAVYLSKRRIDGPEIAAKDLADVVELTKRNLCRIGPPFIDALHKGVRREYKRIYGRILKAEKAG